jgi:tRNA nucleotidyltransferase (CCA-adding enzyme)
MSGNAPLQAPDHWEHYEHEADMGVRGTGATLAAAFEQAALAMTAVITEPRAIEARHAVAVRCEAPDRELLLVDWLNALVYEMATRRMLFGRFEVHIEDGRLEATAWGEPVDRARHVPAVEIKGATYTSLKVEQREDGLWMAQTVVDV